MIKAMLVDDEFIVLEGLKRIIDWEKHGISITSTAENGQQALEMFNEQQPQLILTDICMPGMDGLELLEAVMQAAPDTYVIVFSGFNEFEYVKRAIQLGASDYLEKPITLESVDQALYKAIDHIEKQKNNAELKEKYLETRSSILQKITGELLLGNFQELEQWKELVNQSQHNWSAVTVLACSQAIDEDSIGLSHIKIITVSQKDAIILVLLHHDHVPLELWENIEQYTDCYIGAGQTYAGIDQLAESYMEAKRALRCARYLRTTGTLSFEGLGHIFTDANDISEREEGIILSLRAGNSVGLMEHIEQFIQWIHSKDVDPEIIEREMLKLLYLAIAVTDEIVSNKKIDITTLSSELLKTKDKAELTNWFREQMALLVQSTSKYREDTKSATIEQAKRYMETHIADDLNLQSLASHLNMNPSYLSVLFKEVTGETYIKYVSRFRMEKAKKLLLEGRKVSEVSERVGYYTYRHFTEVFKKYTGITPGQFKAMYELEAWQASQDLKKTDINQ